MSNFTPKSLDRPRKQNTKSKVAAILHMLRRLYPNAHCALLYNSPFQLLIATMLSAQTNDQQVNRVTPHLFSVYPDAYAMARASLPDLEKKIRSINYYRTKGKHIIQASRIIVERFGGSVPLRLEDLTSLPGVGRKTANVVIGELTNNPEGIVVDTHVKRVSQRLGLTTHQNPELIEKDLMNQFPRREWVALAHRLITHGRQICLARQPRCAACGLRHLCLQSLGA
ncbi:MAG: endonuclease III [Bdellovibrionaceae bacterium]|nr:endonuclease III [Pseudobdellovibrionaceae bacterium]MDW8189775.1 endonuclease III [Pseudobdellovibrionaceae bacterium]